MHRTRNAHCFAKEARKRRTIRGEQACFPDERHCDHLLHLIAQRRFRLRDRAHPIGEKLFGERPSDFRDWLHADFRAFRRRTPDR
jgi:hypothetical protein